MPTLRLLVSSLLLLVAPVASAAEDRASQVLEAIQEAVHAKPGAHFNSRNLLMTALETRRDAEAGRSIWVPVLPPHCGTGMQYGGLDVEAASRLARSLFRAYGYGAVTGHAIEVGERRLPIDLLDPEKKVGFLVVPAPLGGAAAPVLPWGDAARRRLRAEGIRVLALPAQHYRCMQADSVTPLLACALSVVDFLNDMAGGENVDVEAIGGGRLVELPLPALKASDLPHTSSFSVTDGNAFFVAKGRGTVALSFTPPKKGGTAGVGVVVLPVYWTPPTTNGMYDFDRPGPRFVLVQDGVRLESESAVFVTPPAFDVAKPFRIRVDYVEGQMHLGGPLTLRRP